MLARIFPLFKKELLLARQRLQAVFARALCVVCKPCPNKGTNQQLRLKALKSIA